MAASTSSSSSSSSFSSRVPRWLHDVFLSFHGDDTRNGFTSHLLAALDRQGFSTFRDDTKLRRGEDISSELLKAIEESRVSIVVFSKNYAASRWCLDELVKIMECRSDFNQIVLPIFYDVDPSHVRAQLGSYSEAFAKHEDRVKEGTLSMSMERVERWKAALTEAANLSGYDLQHVANGDEAKLIKIVIEDTVNRLDRLYLDVADQPVGIDSRVQQLKALLNLGSDDVRIVAVWGVGGLGKTTIAKAIFNCIRNRFEGSSFLADVRDTAKELPGVVKLQEQLLSNILMNETYKLDNYHQGIEEIKKKIRHRRVLLVLDDVDHVEQLKRLAIKRDFFGPGSRIIITTRNKSSISTLQVDSYYSPEALNKDESLKLFSWHAFKANHPKEGYLQISSEIVAYAEGLPLVLEVLGSFLMDRSTIEWQSESNKLKVIPNGEIQQKLKISYDSLDDRNQELFLDIAFFFIGRDKDFTVKVLEDSGCFPEIEIGELSRRCLVRVDSLGILGMHNVLRDMGREIVRQQSLKVPGERSRLWCREEVLQVLKDCTGTKAIEGLSLELAAKNNEDVDTKAFANMSNLRLLHLNYLQCLSGTYITTSRKLKWLCWHGFPLAYIPNALYMENLVAIDLQYSKLKQIWKGPKRLDKLRFLNLSHSCHLTKTPNFSGLKRLEMLFLNDCTSLVKVHNSIECLDKLLMLNMANCRNLSKINFSSLFKLKSLEKLDISGCSNQEYIPFSMASIQGLSCLRELNLADCNLEYVPSGIGSLITLEEVNLSGNKFCSLPYSLSHLSRLLELNLERCVQLKSLAHLPNNLQILMASGCISLETASIGENVGFKFLEFCDCPKLDSKSLSNKVHRNFVQVRDAHNFYDLVYTCGELPNDMEFQCINGSRSLSIVVPPLVDKKIIGFIASAVVSHRFNISGLEIVNKTKGNISPTWRPWQLYCYGLNNRDEDQVAIACQSIEDEWEEGDELDISVFPSVGRSFDDCSKRWGLSFMYGESNIELAN